ncbi:MAG: hypothetical protein QNJ69_05690 [Gammaproteobacteria bacterium]|nr:hypothetical protein [Gammaproteobacteria bacterium]
MAERDGPHRYYVDVLQHAVDRANLNLRIELLHDIPRKRTQTMLANNQLSVKVLVRSQERDAMFTPVRIGLTNGLIGTRILLVPRGESYRYANVNSLQDLREIDVVGAFGTGWYDVKVWTRNELKHVTVDGDWEPIFNMLASRQRGIDYFSRGATEIVANARDYPELEIEPRLALVYDRDFIFYLSPATARYRDALEQALKDMQLEGDFERLQQKHWGENLGVLALDRRIRLNLE